MKRTFAWIGFFIALSLAVFAFFYNPPGVMQRTMLRAVARESVWAVQAEGTLEQGQLHLDLLKRGDGAQFARISYPPLKLLNNQWVELPGVDSPPLNLPLQEGEKKQFPPLPEGGRGGVGGSGDIFDHLILTKRLTTFKDLWHRRERFEFALNVPQFVQGTGTLWLDGRTRLPQQATLVVTHNPKPSTVHLQFAYSDPTSGLPLSARPLQEVLAQLEEVAKAHNGKPKKLLPLGEAHAAPTAFSHDFDHDGLSDALELFYGTDPANPDTDNDTHLDGVEVEGGYDPAGAGKMQNAE